MALLSLVAFAGPGAAQPARRDEILFEIASQPLAEALLVYARTAGIEILVDDGILSGRRSAAISGSFHPTIALRHMVATSGLDIRYVDRGAVTLLPHQPADPTVVAERYAGFSVALQSALAQSMCGHDATASGAYRVGAQLWIGPSGEVEHALLLNGTGDRGRDAAITRRLEALRIGQPRPADLPQPATVVYAAGSARDIADCASLRAGRLP